MKRPRVSVAVAVLAVFLAAFGYSGQQAAAASRHYRGTWNGDTSQLKVISFQVNTHNAITSVEVQYHISGKKDCGFTRTETKRFKPPVAIEGSSFKLSWDGFTVRGTFTSAKTAKGSVNAADKAKGCSGKTKETWAAGKGAPRADVYEGSWEGPATFQLSNGGSFQDDMGFEVEGDGITSVFFPYIGTPRKVGWPQLPWRGSSTTSSGGSGSTARTTPAT